MKRLLLILIVIFVSCKDPDKTVVKKEKVENDFHDVEWIERKEFKPFFTSDKIDHYY